MDSVASPRRASRLASLAVWLAAALLYGLAAGASALLGLKLEERGIDTRSIRYLITAGTGAGLGLLALAPVYRWLVPPRTIFRYPLALVMVAGASAAMIAGLALLQTDTPWDALGPGLDPVHRIRMIVEPFAAYIFIFLSIGFQPMMPQGLLPLLLAGWWVGRRRARTGRPAKSDAALH